MMAIGPINVGRVTQNMRADTLSSSIGRTQLDLFTQQARIASGRSFLFASENPIAASRVLDLSQALAQQRQFTSNAQYGDNTLSAADSALTEVNSLLIEAQSIASQNASNLTSAAEREAESELIAGIRRQLQIVANRSFNGRFLFAGQSTTKLPFVDALGGIAYVGDTEDLVTRVSESLTPSVNVPGSDLFRALSEPITTNIDLSPSLDLSTRLDSLDGAAGQGIRSGILVLNEVGGAGTVSVDLSQADTVGDVIDLINEAATSKGAGFSAALADGGITITPAGNPVAVTDASVGAISSDLGILTSSPSSDPIVGLDLRARLTSLTPVDAIAQGNGIDLEKGFIIANGARTQTIDLSTAKTVQDIINAINGAGVGALARISADGQNIDVLNRVSGTSLSIGENGGTTATDLGIRTFEEATTLDQLNFGLGVVRSPGKNDIRIFAQDGSTVDVDLDSAVTIGDVIVQINDAATEAGVSITASFVDVGNGIQLKDGTTGTETMKVVSINLSQAATDLGLDQATSVTAGEMIGSDRNPRRTEGIFGALTDLENAMRADDTKALTLAAERLGPFIQDVTRVRGVLGARSQAMQAKLNQIEDAATAMEIELSNVQDLDVTEAVTRMQSTITQLQANLQTSSVILNLSLMDFLQ